MCKCVGCLSLYRVHRLVLDIVIGIDITQRKRWSQYLCREIETHCQYPFINFVKLFVIAKSTQNIAKGFLKKADPKSLFEKGSPKTVDG